KNYVISHRPGPSLPGLEFVNEPLDEFAARLRAQPGKNVWIMGGGGIIGSLLDVGGVDEFIIHVIPTFIGEGIPLIAPRQRRVRLRLLSSKQFSDGVVRLHYAVDRRSPRRKAKSG